MTEKKNNRLHIRNSTVDFLMFTKGTHEDGIKVRVQGHDVWLTQKAIAKAFAESEFEQYRIIQDRLYQSNFGRLVASTKEED